MTTLVTVYAPTLVMKLQVERVSVSTITMLRLVSV